jgi:hypothetical protein
MKFKTSGAEYKAKREELAKRLGERNVWSFVDHYPLYCGIQTLSRFVALEAALRSTLTVPGHVAEFGTFRGGSLMLFAKLLRMWDAGATKEVHGFDSFEGLTEFSEHDPHDEEGDYAFTGQYKGSLEELQALIELDNFQDEVELHVGYIENTLPQYLEEHPAAHFSLVLCDTDLYQSTKLILDSMHPRMMKGGVFILDEWNFDYFPGESVALDEFLSEHSAEYHVEHVPQTRQPSLMLRKL